MEGVSEVIAIILILMITIAISGLAYTFMSSTMASTTAAASSAVDTTTSSMKTSFVIENVDIAKVYIRNNGEVTLSNISVYVNDEPAIYNITPAIITAGQVGTVTIYSFIPDGATVKVTSPSGFSASKAATPCSKAVGCWKFDEGSGTTAYDSSPYGNDGTLANGPAWTSGRYGNGLLLDGINDFVNASNRESLNITGGLTISGWIKVSNTTGNEISIVNKYQGNWGTINNGYQLVFSPTGNNNFGIRISVGSTRIEAWSSTLLSIQIGMWYYVVGTWNGTTASLYINGNLIRNVTAVGNMQPSSSSVSLGGGTQNGTIDEVRIYNRVIY